MKRRRVTSSAILKDSSLSVFERRVYEAVSGIPRGEVRSYAWVARMAGSPKACRAVGNALNKNRYTDIIPCHRVIKSDGSIGGYARGTSAKRRMLKSEGVDGL
ncbi:MAG: MGMT family protein [Candidatus Omnitrophota bacterium]